MITIPINIDSIKSFLGMLLILSTGIQQIVQIFKPYYENLSITIKDKKIMIQQYLDKALVVLFSLGLSFLIGLDSFRAVGYSANRDIIWVSYLISGLILSGGSGLINALLNTIEILRAMLKQRLSG
jgi:hypothetical protein